MLRRLFYHDTVALQETHGQVEYLREMEIMAPFVWVFGSMSGGTGGVITTIHKRWCDRQPECVVIRQGFVLATHGMNDQCPFSIFNVHVHPHLNALERLSLFRDIKSNMRTGYVNFILGDFNSIA